MARSIFRVQVVIQNKPYLSDPEGETIYKDLIIKGGYSSVKSVRSAKLLEMVINSSSEEEAKEKVTQLCHELRIFNPVVSTCRVTVTEKATL